MNSAQQWQKNNIIKKTKIKQNALKLYKNIKFFLNHSFQQLIN